MTLEDYAPVKTIGPCPMYYGPKPPAVGYTSWGWPEQYVLFYQSKGIESVSGYIPKEEFNAEQAELRRWDAITKAMREIQSALDRNWLAARDPHRIRFYSQMDQLSAMGCYYCEHIYHTYEGGYKLHHCMCHDCETCGSKYCEGCLGHTDGAD